MFSRDSPEIQSSLRPLSQSEPWGGSMNEEECPLETEHTLAVVLPEGLERTTRVNGSKPVMDLMVSLCAQYHLNPSDVTVELQSANRNDIAFKPSSLIGSMEADRILLKPKGVEEKTRTPYVPEATVRLLINYKKNHKAVVRVSPRVPLELLLPSICEKCEFDLESTILLKDEHSDEPLDLTRSLNDHGLRELYAKGPAVTFSPEVVLSAPPTEAPAEESGLTLKEKKQKGKENRGLFSLFRRIKKKPKKGGCASALTSPGLKNHCETSVSMNSLAVRSSNTLPSKKRRAPLPPIAGSQSVPTNLNIQPLTSRKKKRAPMPPHCPSPPLQDTEVEGNGVFLYTVEEEREDLHSSSSSPDTSSPLARPQTPPSASRFSATLPSSPPTTPSVGEILTPFLLSQTRAKLKQPSLSTPRPVSSTNGGSPLSSAQSGAWREVSPLHLLQLKANMLGEAWRSPGQREGMTTFTVVPRGQSLRRQRGFDVDLTLDPPKTWEPSQTINQPCDGVPDPGWDDKPASQQGAEKEATSPKLDVDPSPGIPECSIDCVVSPQAVSSTVELYETAPNSPVEESQEEPQSPVNTQKRLESISEVPNPYSTDLFTLTNNIISGNEVTSTPAASESTGMFQKPDLRSEEEAEEGRFSFPPPPAPLCCNKRRKKTGVMTEASQLRVKVPGGRNPSPPSYPPPSPPTQSPSCAPAEGDNVANSHSSPNPNMIHLTFPSPYVPPAASRSMARKTSIPSSFAQAVAVAVRKAQASSPRQRAATHPGPSSGSSPSPSPLPNTGSD